MTYSIDTSSILDAWRRHSPPDVFPALWTNLEQLIGTGLLRASEEVRNELERKDDEVLAWAKKQSGFYVPLDKPIQISVRTILAGFPKLLDTMVNRSGADPFAGWQC